MKAASLQWPEPVRGRGLFLIPDPHVAATPPGQRLEGFMDQVLDKLSACLGRARELDMVPVVLGDLFHLPRENPNQLLVVLMDLFSGHKPFVLVGNHDKYQARLTRDVSLAVLETAGVVRVIKRDGPVFLLRTGDGDALVCASPDGFPLPKAFEMPGVLLEDDQGDHQALEVVWLTHHNIAFPEFEDRRHRLREIPGVDWIINGHIHRPQPTIAKGRTTWANPGNIVRLTFSVRSLKRRPAASIWRPGCTDLEKWEVPHLDFHQVFPDQDFPKEAGLAEGESRFLEGLERLAWRRTREGVGLRQFLESNLDSEEKESTLIWQLYEEVTGGKSQGD